MLHFHIKYTANVESIVDIGELCETIRAAAADNDTFLTAGIRVPANRVDHVPSEIRQRL